MIDSCVVIWLVLLVVIYIDVSVFETQKEEGENREQVFIIFERDFLVYDLRFIDKCNGRDIGLMQEYLSIVKE